MSQGCLVALDDGGSGGTATMPAHWPTAGVTVPVPAMPGEPPPDVIPTTAPLPPMSTPGTPPSPPGQAAPEAQTHAPEALHLQALQPSSASLRTPDLQVLASHASLWQLQSLSAHVHWVQRSAPVAVAPFLEQAPPS